LDNEVKKNYDNNNNLHLVNLKLDQTEKDNQLLQDDRDKLELIKRRLIEENEQLKRAEKDNEVKLNKLKNNVNELRTAFQALNSTNKAYVQKLANIVDESDLSTNFIVTIQNYDKYFSDPTDKKITESSRHAQEFSRALCTEIEILYDKIRNNNEIIKDTTSRIKNLEQNMHALTLNNEEKSVSERKMTQHIKSLTEENQSLSMDKISLESQNDKVTREIRQYKAEHKQVVEELNILKEELTKMKVYSDEVVKDNHDKYNLLKTYNFQIDALEERIIVLVKEKKYLESLINRLSRSHPSSEMHRLMNDILNINDGLSTLEREKIKVDNSLSLIELEFKQYQDQNRTTDFGTDLRKEREQLKQLSYEYERKIGK
jgi:chromosome segregation ATPase